MVWGGGAKDLPDTEFRTRLLDTDLSSGINKREVQRSTQKAELLISAKPFSTDAPPAISRSSCIQNWVCWGVRYKHCERKSSRSLLSDCKYQSCSPWPRCNLADDDPRPFRRFWKWLHSFSFSVYEEEPADRPRKIWDRRA